MGRTPRSAGDLRPPGFTPGQAEKNIPNQCFATIGRLTAAVAKIAPPRMNLTPGYRD
jgi:hypothetical protein